MSNINIITYVLEHKQCLIAILTFAHNPLEVHLHMQDMRLVCLLKMENSASAFGNEHHRNTPKQKTKWK